MKENLRLKTELIFRVTPVFCLVVAQVSCREIITWNKNSFYLILKVIYIYINYLLRTEWYESKIGKKICIDAKDHGILASGAANLKLASVYKHEQKEEV